jgi:hypothetical protein
MIHHTRPRFFALSVLPCLLTFGACGGQAMQTRGDANPLAAAGNAGSSMGATTGSMNGSTTGTPSDGSGGTGDTNGATTGNSTSPGVAGRTTGGTRPGDGGAPTSGGASNGGEGDRGGSGTSPGGSGGETGATGGSPNETGDLAPDGEPCTSADDCESGICEGEGCESAGGTCVPEFRACTRDLREYCGCDGETFSGSGSCPGARYESAGPCEGGDDGTPGSGGAGQGSGGNTSEPGNGANGDSCSAPSDCASGICEGEGCGEGGGTCASNERICTLDYVEYCGCDGETFGGSGNCPGQRYQSTGPCE